MASVETTATSPVGPVLFAYDGSQLAGLAIERAAREISTDRNTVVVCVWQPADVGFEPINKQHFDADAANEVRRAAEETAEYGASLATRAGVRAASLAVEAAPTWQGIVETARTHHASLIVLGSHRRSGLIGHFHGNVAAAVITHASSSVLVVHQGS